MNLNIGKSLLLSVLLCSAVFAVTMVSIGLYAVHAITGNPANRVGSENSVTLTYISDPADGRYTLCGGDPVGGGGHP
jgi:hypothetical protein